MERGLIKDPLKDRRCYTKSSTVFFSNLAPKAKITTADFKTAAFRNSLNSADFLTQLNLMGQNGYKFIGYDTPTKDSGIVNTYMKLANDSAKFSHIAENRTNTVVADNYFSWRAQLNEKGKTGYQHLHTIRPTTEMKYIDYFIKKENDTASYTYDSGYVAGAVDPTALETMLNSLGTQGCRIIEFKSYFTGNHPEILDGKVNQPKIATCVNSSAHNGTYSYRYKANPSSTTALQTMLDEQAKEGYRLVSMSLDMSSTNKNGLLFMKDSENTNVGEFKVFSEKVFRNLTFNDVLAQRLNQQGTLGWLFTNGQSMYATNPKSLQTDLSDFNLID
ncbi:hypothetical protein D7V32_04810 [Acinetobacter tianfuensis]|uniref:Uncharacterized protein n=2 Tax=Acinetobacter tianfuensis TaxID=2419603 RepID=A0A3A8EPX7_9GAMM|nr:hypothetical protein D7V32_04810 [Acinetobacter tianfuensis]